MARSQVLGVSVTEQDEVWTLTIIWAPVGSLSKKDWRGATVTVEHNANPGDVATQLHRVADWMDKDKA